MKISARNVLKGRIVDVHKGATIANVKIDVPASSSRPRSQRGGR
jgi:molybdopterin-binding protein